MNILPDTTRKCAVWVACALFPIFPLLGCAEEHKTEELTSRMLSDIGIYLEGTDISVIGEIKSPPTPVYTGWNVSWADEFINWGVDKQLLGHKLATKIGFVRGKYDAFAKTYKAEPVITVLDTSIPNSFTILPYMGNGQKINQNWTNDVGAISVNIEIKNQQVTISNPAQPGEKILVPYGEMVSQWSNFASRYALLVSGKRYYAIPQTIWGNNTYYSGFVVTEDAPLFYTTNLPQDYVEVFRKKDGETTYAPKAYSLPLHLTFELSTTQKNTWEVHAMTEAERVHCLTDSFFQQNPISGVAE